MLGCGGLILAILNQIIDLGMRDDIRYGMYCFSYIYDTAAIFSWYCYMFILVLSIDLLNGVNRKKNYICAIKHVPLAIYRTQ